MKSHFKCCGNVSSALQQANSSSSFPVSFSYSRHHSTGFQHHSSSNISRVHDLNYQQAALPSPASDCAVSCWPIVIQWGISLAIWQGSQGSFPYFSLVSDCLGTFYVHGPTCFSSSSEGLDILSNCRTRLEDKVQRRARLEPGTLAVQNTSRAMSGWGPLDHFASLPARSNTGNETTHGSLLSWMSYLIRGDLSVSWRFWLFAKTPDRLDITLQLQQVVWAKKFHCLPKQAHS